MIASLWSYCNPYSLGLLGYWICVILVYSFLAIGFKRSLSWYDDTWEIALLQQHFREQVPNGWIHFDGRGY